MGWKKRSVLIVGILVALYTVVGFLVIPLIAESVLPDKLSEQLNRPAAVENVSVNPYTLTLSLERLEVQEKSGEKDFISFDRFFVNLQWSSLFKLAPVVKEVRLENPLVRIVRVSETEFNFSDLIPSGKDQQPPATDKQEPFRFFLSNLSLSGGEIIFRDAVVDKTHRFSGINLALPVLSNFETNIDEFAQPALAGDVNKTRLKVDASTKPFADSLETVVDVTLKDISLPRYFAYVPVPLGFSVAGGRLDINSAISFRHDPKDKSRLEISGTADFSDLKLVETDASEILSIPSMHIQMAPSAPLEKNIRIEAIEMRQPVATVMRRANGNLNLAELGPPKAETSEPETEEEPAEKAESTASPFVFELDRFKLDAGTVRFRDYAVPSASAGPSAGPLEMQMTPIDLTVSDFSNRSGDQADIDFSAKLIPDAALSVDGSFGIVPLGADVDVQIKDLGLNRAQPYFPDNLNVVVSDGRLDLSGSTQFRMDPDSGPSAQFTGAAGVSNFTVVEEKTARDFTQWSDFDLNGMDVSWNPDRIHVETVSLAGLRQQVVVEKDGSLNFSHIYETEPAGKTKPADSAAGAPFPISVGEVKLSDLLLFFTDYNIEPHYSSRLSFSEGSIKGLSTEAFDGADVSINGAVNKHAPLSVAGKINPLLEDLLLDLNLDLQNLEMTRLSPYAGKYVGRAIEKGKLNLDLAYRVKNKKLEAQNQILLDQFDLGQDVESDEAVNLPLDLALALLKNRQGKIDLDLPVSGRLDDPKFSVAGVVLQSLKNLVTKAATSPFSLVSAIVSGGEELRYIGFKAGRSGLTDEAVEKLKSMQKLLFERPNLNLELTGYVNREKDRQALARMALERKIRAAKWADRNGEKAEDSKTIEEIKLTEEEYGKYLGQLYKAEVLSGPNAAEDAKPLSDETLTADEMKERIRQRIEIKDARLRVLAEKRVKAVKDFILQDERIAAKRLFIREANSLTPAEPGKFKKNRVELDLR